MKVYNQRNGVLVADQLQIADRFFPRLRGLIGRKSLKPREGLLLTPCSSVHTFFMDYPIDVLFLNQDFKVLKINHSLKANRMTLPKGCQVLELYSGRVLEADIRLGDRLVIKKGGSDG